MVQEYQSLDVRPYELMHIVAYLGAGRGDDLGDARLNTVLARVRQNPSLPLKSGLGRCPTLSAAATNAMKWRCFIKTPLCVPG